MSWPRLVIALALVVPLLAGCWYFSTDRNRGGFDVYNYTDQPLDIYYVDFRGREQKVYTGLTPGYSVPINGLLLGPDDCRGPLIARDPAGSEVARHPEPICNNDEWVIGTPPP